MGNEGRNKENAVKRNQRCKNCIRKNKEQKKEAKSIKGGGK